MEPAELTARISGVGAHGEGVGRLPDGRAVFVHRTAPGDDVTVTLDKEADRWARGRLVRVLEPSPERRVAPCPYYTRCGGCSLQHLEYSAQLHWKKQRAEETVARIAGIECGIESITGSPEEFRYRSRVTMHLRRLASKEVVAGFHQLSSPGRVLDVDGACLLMEPLLARAWDGLRGAWGPGARHLPLGRALDLTLQVVGAGVVLTIRGGSGGGDAAALMSAVPELAAIWAVGSRGSRLLHGAETVTEILPEDEISLGPTAFVQANKAGAELLWGMLADELGDVRGLRIVDAYSGAGAFGRRWARAGASVLAIEFNGDAVLAARTGAPPGYEVVQARVEDRLGEALPADVVVLNPPRTGVARETVEALLGAPPARLLYVSCDPATLARDLERLAGAYDPVRLRALDLFPQTGHLELLATLKAT